MFKKLMCYLFAHKVIFAQSLDQNYSRYHCIRCKESFLYDQQKDKYVEWSGMFHFIYSRAGKEIVYLPEETPVCTMKSNKESLS